MSSEAQILAQIKVSTDPPAGEISLAAPLDKDNRFKIIFLFYDVFKALCKFGTNQ